MKRKPSASRSKFHAEEAILFVLLLFIGLLIFYPARQAGFITDFTQYPTRFAGKSWTGIFSSFGFPGVQPLTMSLVYWLYTNYGTAYRPWYLLFTCLHVFNACLLYAWIRQYMSLLKADRSGIAAAIAAALFLLSPYAAEPVVWKNDLQYLLCTCFFFMSLIALNRYLQIQNPKTLLILSGLFFASLLSFELSLAGPAIFVVLARGYRQSSAPAKDLRSLLPGALYGPLIAIGMYVLLTFVQTGTLIPHYGAATHLHFDPRQIAGNYFNYLFKYALDSRMWSHSARTSLRTWIEKPDFQLAALAVLLCCALAAFFLFKKMGRSLQLSLLLLACFSLALLPVINLYFYDLGYLENDRYGYLAAAFFYSIPAICLGRIRGPIAGSFAILLIGIQSFFLLKMNLLWGQSAGIYNNLLKTYAWQDDPDVYLLAFADNLNGALLFRDLKGKVSFSDAYTLIAQKKVTGRMTEIAQFNMTSPADGLSASWKDANTIILEFRQWGNWWWHKSIGMSPWETPEFSVKPQGQQCEIHFKKLPAHPTFIYQDGDHWVELKHPVAKVPD